MRKYLLITCLFFASNTFANWEYTNWGMAQDQVTKAAEKHKIEIVGLNDSEAKEKINREQQVRSIGEFRFIAHFFYDKKLLRSVSFIPYETQSYCFDVLKKTLSVGRLQGINPKGTIYASSSEEEWVWVDPSGKIDLFLRKDAFKNNCSITYDAGDEFTNLYEGKE